MDKKGLATLQMFVFVFFAFLGIIFLGLAMWGFNLISTNIGVDIDVGNVNLQNVTNQTFGRLNAAFLDMGDSIGIILILGMCLLMIVNGYFLGSRIPVLFFIIDFFIIIFVFLLSVYISQSYDTLINSTSLLSIYGDNLPKSSAFILKLPLVCSIVGVLIMIVTYAGFKKDDGEIADKIITGEY